MLSVTLFTVASNGNNPHGHQDVGGQTGRLRAHMCSSSAMTGQPTAHTVGMTRKVMVS